MRERRSRGSPIPVGIVSIAVVQQDDRPRLQLGPHPASNLLGRRPSGIPDAEGPAEHSVPQSSREPGDKRVAVPMGGTEHPRHPPGDRHDLRVGLLELRADAARPPPMQLHVMLGVIAELVAGSGRTPCQIGKASHVLTNQKERGRDPLAFQRLQNRGRRARVGTVVKGEVQVGRGASSMSDRATENRAVRIVNPGGNGA